MKYYLVVLQILCLNICMGQSYIKELCHQIDWNQVNDWSNFIPSSYKLYDTILRKQSNGWSYAIWEDTRAYIYVQDPQGRWFVPASNPDSDNPYWDSCFPGTVQYSANVFKISKILNNIIDNDITQSNGLSCLVELEKNLNDTEIPIRKMVQLESNGNPLIEGWWIERDKEFHLLNGEVIHVYGNKACVTKERIIKLLISEATKSQQIPEYLVARTIKQPNGWKYAIWTEINQVLHVYMQDPEGFWWGIAKNDWGNYEYDCIPEPDNMDLVRSELDYIIKEKRVARKNVKPCCQTDKYNWEIPEVTKVSCLIKMDYFDNE